MNRFYEIVNEHPDMTMMLICLAYFVVAVYLFRVLIGGEKERKRVKDFLNRD